MSDELKQAAQEIVDFVGPERLMRNYNLTSMEIPGDMLRRLAQAAVPPKSGQTAGQDEAEPQRLMDPVELTNTAQYAAFKVMAAVHAWHWVRVGAAREASEVMGALERLRVRMKDGGGPKEAEGMKWDELAQRWARVDSAPGPAIHQRTTGA